MIKFSLVSTKNQKGRQNNLVFAFEGGWCHLFKEIRVGVMCDGDNGTRWKLWHISFNWFVKP